MSLLHVVNQSDSFKGKLLKSYEMVQKAFLSSSFLSTEYRWIKMLQFWRTVLHGEYLVSFYVCNVRSRSRKLVTISHNKDINESKLHSKCYRKFIWYIWLLLSRKYTYYVRYVKFM